MYSCRILADSNNPKGVRLTTLELCYPRIVHAEFMTHRVFSRNAASNRAIPVAKLLSVCYSDPFVPLTWPKNQKGMVGGDLLEPFSAELAEKEWLAARDDAVHHAEIIANLGVHKSIPNRLLEPFQWITVICTSTEWNNFFNLRIAPDAEQHIRKIAQMMVDAIEASTPVNLAPGEWHLPLLEPEDKERWDLKNKGISLAKISAGKCGRVSYLTHDGRRDLIEDINLCNRFVVDGHWSPLEHPCRCEDTRRFSGNVRGFTQYRKLFTGENRTDYKHGS
jgi:hypothetical protein